jgi:hypothetical protein
MLPNRADFYVPVLAAWRCGAAISLVDPLQQPGQSSSRAEISAGWAENKTRRRKKPRTQFFKKRRKFVVYSTDTDLLKKKVFLRI